MAEIKLVVTDIDGTLVPIGSHEPTPAVQQAMDSLHQAGVVVAAATARPYEAARNLFLGLGFTGPSIFDGGASVRDVQTGELLWQNWLSVDRLAEIAKVVLPHAASVDFFPTYKMVPPSETGLHEIVEPAPYVWALVEEVAFSGVLQQLRALPGLNVHPGVGKPDRPGFIDVQITDQSADKFHAVRELRALLNCTKEQTLAIGDSGNDVPLFRNAGIRVAMGNAIDELKAEADYLVASVGNDGWAEAMNSLVLGVATE